MKRKDRYLHYGTLLLVLCGFCGAAFGESQIFFKIAQTLYAVDEVGMIFRRLL